MAVFNLLSFCSKFGCDVSLTAKLCSKVIIVSFESLDRHITLGSHLAR